VAQRAGRCTGTPRAQLAEALLHPALRGTERLAGRAGKRAFAIAYFHDGRLRAGFWVGIERQGLYTADPRFSIPPYMGHNGWIALDVSRRADRKELAALALQSYRHFALKRMLSKLA
jgi:hypothetical protein